MDPVQQGLVDERDVQAVGLRYARSLDTRQFDLLLTCFTEDAAWGMEGGMAEGHAAIAKRASTALTRLDATQHVTTNFEVEVSGDSATMRSYYLATHARAGHPHWVVAGVYDDELVRTPDGWRIRRRLLTGLWETGDASILGEDYAALRDK